VDVLNGFRMFEFQVKLILINGHRAIENLHVDLAGRRGVEYEIYLSSPVRGIGLDDMDGRARDEEAGVHIGLLRFAKGELGGSNARQDFIVAGMFDSVGDTDRRGDDFVFGGANV
jgi:hypothetical protein